MIEASPGHTYLFSTAYTQKAIFLRDQIMYIINKYIDAIGEDNHLRAEERQLNTVNLGIFERTLFS